MQGVALTLTKRRKMEARLLTPQELASLFKGHWHDAMKEAAKAQDAKTFKAVVEWVEANHQVAHYIQDKRVPEDGNWHITNGIVIYEDEWQAFKKELQVVARVDAHMGCQPVAHLSGQVVDKRYVAEVVLPTPVDAVGFERIAAVGGKNHHSTAWFKNARHLAHC